MSATTVLLLLSFIFLVIACLPLVPPPGRRPMPWLTMGLAVWALAELVSSPGLLHR